MKQRISLKYLFILQTKSLILIIGNTKLINKKIQRVVSEQELTDSNLPIYTAIYQYEKIKVM